MLDERPSLNGQDLRRQAMYVATMLPADRAEALAVLGYVKDLLDWEGAKHVGGKAVEVAARLLS